VSAEVKSLFDRISGDYDLLNRVLSARRDLVWRRRAVDLLAPAPRLVADLACGTYDLSRDLVRRGRARRVIGLDFSAAMLRAGRSKIAGLPIAPCAADALHLPLADGSVDACTIAYGWRNFDDPAAALAEIHRVLRPGGELLLLEFFRPRAAFPRAFSATYGRVVLPLAGLVLAGDAAAYAYLNRSIESFLDLAGAERLLRANGFARPRWRRFFAGLSDAVAVVKEGE